MDRLPEKYRDQGEKIIPLPGISMHDFMRRTAIYEQMPVPFTVKMRRAAWIGMGLTLLNSLLIVLMPVITGIVRVIFFPLVPQSFNGYLLSYLHGLGQIALLEYANGVLLVSGVVLLLLTRNLRRGNVGQQWLACAQAVGGSVNLALLFLPLLIIAVNLFSWLLVVLCGMLILALFVNLLSAWGRA